MPDWKKLIEGKISLAKRGAKPGKINENIRVPAGQSEVKNFPILDLGILPDVTKETWALKFYGLNENPFTLDWVGFQAMPQVTDVSDFHCVTRWTRLDMDWQGVRLQDLIMQAAPMENARFVTLHAYDGYTTNLPLEALLDEDVILAHSVLGYPLTSAHGGPARLIVPKRYAWKGAKWISAIEFHAEDRLGFWEVRGYHNDADPWLEQRFSDG